MPNPIKSLSQDLGEAIGQPIASEAKQVFEQGVASITGKAPPSASSLQNSPQPQNTYENKAVETKRLQNIRAYFDSLKLAQQKLEQQRSKDLQEKQIKDQEEDKKKEVREIQIVRKDQSFKQADLASKQRRVEMKKGSF